MPKAKPFTNVSVDKLKHSGKSAYAERHSGPLGFGLILQVKPNHKKSWVQHIIVEHQGNRKRIVRGLGPYSKVSLQNKALDDTAYHAVVRTRYRTLLTPAKRELPPPPPPPPKRLTGQRGRPAKSDAESRQEALTHYETEVLRFARDPDVPFTNNRADRDIRMAKVKQKVSGCFRTPRYADAYCRISSYLQSMTLTGYNPLAAIEIALKGDAATMVEKPLKNKTVRKNQNQGKGGE